MCFSAQASFTAATILAAIAMAMARKVRTHAQWLLVVIPISFSIQQALEGIVWLTLNSGDAVSMMHTVAVYGFLFFALVVWPSYIPFSLYIFESNAQRKLLLFANMMMGICVSLVLGISYFYFGVVAHSVHNYITYESASALLVSPYLYYLGLMLYIWVTVGSLLFSTVPRMWIMGIVIGASCAAAYSIYYTTFLSVWCFFAAVISVMTCWVLNGLNTNLIEK